MAINKVINKSTKSHGAMRNVIEYVLQNEKVHEGYVTLTGPYAYDTLNWDNVYNAFLDEKRLWHKDTGRMYAHNIISFHKDERITAAQCLEIGEEFTNNFFNNHQSLICIHQDKEHLHIHIITNSVSYVDGLKLHQTKKDLERQKNFTNNLCLERKLSVTEKGKHFNGNEIEEGHTTAWSKDKYNLFMHDDKKSYVTECAIAVMNAKENCCSKEDFIRGMEESGWSVTWSENKKHITFQDSNGNKVRDSNLSKTFLLNINKEVLFNEFIRQNEFRLTKLKSARELERQQKLDKYSSEVKSALRGDVNFKESVQSPKGTEKEKRSSNEVWTTSRSTNVTGAFIKDIQSTIDSNRAQNRTIEYTENKSIVNQKQRFAEKKQRTLAKTRTERASRRARNNDEPCL